MIQDYYLLELDNEMFNCINPIVIYSTNLIISKKKILNVLHDSFILTYIKLIDLN